MYASQNSPQPSMTGAQSGRIGSTDAVALPLWLYLIFCVLSVVPFIAVAHPPIVDFPNHAARLGLQCAMNDPVVAAMYSFKLGLIPNLAADLINAPLCGIVAPALVLKGTIVAALAILYCACWQIQRHLHGATNPFLLFVPAMSLNVVTTIGYINFLSGVAIAAAMIALALRWPRMRSLVLIGNAGGLLLFFAHIFALAFAVVFFFGWFLKWPVRLRGFIEAGLRTFAMFAVPLALIPFVPSESAELSISYMAKLRAVFAPFLVHSGAQAILIPVALVVPFYLLWRHGRLALHPRMRLPLLMVAIYIAVVPSQLQDAVDIDSRTSVALAYLLFASLAPAGTGRPVAKLLSLLAAVPLIAHLVTVATVWVPFSRQVDEFRAAIAVLPAQATILSVGEGEGKPRTNIAPPVAYSHLASHATADRRVFNPLEFTGIGMQPLRATGRFAAYDVPASMPLPVEAAAALKSPDALTRYPVLAKQVSYAHRWPERFDYVVYYHFGANPNFDPGTLRLVRQGSFFSLLEVRRPR